MFSGICPSFHFACSRWLKNNSSKDETPYCLTSATLVNYNLVWPRRLPTWKIPTTTNALHSIVIPHAIHVPTYKKTMPLQPASWHAACNKSTCPRKPQREINRVVYDRGWAGNGGEGGKKGEGKGSSYCNNTYLIVAVPNGVP